MQMVHNKASLLLAHVNNLARCRKACPISAALRAHRYCMASIPLERATDSPLPRTEARVWMAITLLGVLLACLAAALLLPLRLWVSEE